MVVQIHYHPSGKSEEDQSSLGLKFSGPPTKGRAGIILSNRRIDIPAGDAHYVVKTGVDAAARRRSCSASRRTPTISAKT